MEKFGIIGDPVKGSKSPVLFRAGYECKYQYDLIEGSDFEASWKRFLDEYHAINVTAPFKEPAFRKALSLAREGKGTISGPCMKTGATNLIVKTADGIEAHNSDFKGIILSVADTLYPGIMTEFYDKFGPEAYKKIHQFFRQNMGQVYDRQPQALVIGCGGAGRAAAVAAAELGYATALMNRTPEKARKIAEEMPEYDFIVVPMTDFKASLKECDLVIYTLPVKIDAIDRLEKEDFAGEGLGNGPVKMILEANYKTPSFREEQQRLMYLAGCKYIPGIKWLACQALTGYGLMTGIQPDFRAMVQALEASNL